MSTRTAKKTTARKPRPTPAPDAPKPLPRRGLAERRPFITDIQIRAAYAAALAGVTYTRITGWQHQADGTVAYDMPSGAALSYTPFAETPLTALTPCAHGHHHTHPVTTPADLRDAQHTAASCTGTTPPEPAALTAALKTVKTERALADVLAKSNTSNDETLQTDVSTLRAAHADTEQPKEHPDHG